MSVGKSPIIRLGVSACLLGDEVRYDGSHARDRYVVDTLAEHFTFVKVCPEEEIGMGTPRETVRLVGRRNDPRMVAPGSGKDWTRRMNSWAGSVISLDLALCVSRYFRVTCRSPTAMIRWSVRAVRCT